MHLKGADREVAGSFFLLAVSVFLLQVIFGLLGAMYFLWPNLRVPLDFNVVRMLHINALVIWLLAGFMGSTYYLLKQEAGGRLYSERLAWWNFWLFSAGVLLVVAGYLYMGLSGNYSRLFSEGREYIEAPRWADVYLVVVLGLFLFNTIMTVKRHAHRDAITGLLVVGLTALAFFYLFGMKFFKNMSLDFYFWWWVVHLWVEGCWELIAASLYALLAIRLFGFPRQRAIKYLYVEAGLVLFTGILGMGHHYYWIGTPKYWLLVGGVFSAMEPIPLLIMVFDSLRLALREKRLSHPNRLAQYWLVGGVIMHFLGAGVWGFAQTLPQVNRWTHGTQLTAAHGHIAFFGAYAMLIIACIYYALPRWRFGQDNFDQRRGLKTFWFMVVGVMGMTLALTCAGIMQVFMERLWGLPFLEVQGYMGFFYLLRLIFGGLTAVGVGLLFLDVLRPIPLRLSQEVAESYQESFLCKT
jgi:nitric oxide reductase subunit B